MEKKFKQFTIETPTFTGERKMSFVISTAGVDRDNDTINPKGWDTKNYMANPVVMWAHDYDSLPVAKATHLSMTEKGLSAEIQFPPSGTYPFADTVHDMLKSGFLNATSVGFRAKAFEQNSERKGFDYSEQELLEFSIVPVPSNPEALVTQRAAGIDDAVVTKWCTQITKWAGKKNIDEAHAVEAVSSYIHGLPTWKEFAKDVHVETEAGEKALPPERLHKLLGLHGLLVASLPRQEQTAAFTPEQLSALDVLFAQRKQAEAELKTLEHVEALELVDIEGPDDDDEIEIVSTTKADGGLEIDEEQFTRCMRACVQDAVADVIGGEVRGALNRLRGRVD